MTLHIQDMETNPYKSLIKKWRLLATTAHDTSISEAAVYNEKDRTYQMSRYEAFRECVKDLEAVQDLV